MDNILIDVSWWNENGNNHYSLPIENILTITNEVDYENARFECWIEYVQDSESPRAGVTIANISFYSPTKMLNFINFLVELKDCYINPKENKIHMFSLQNIESIRLTEPISGHVYFESSNSDY